MAPEQPWYHRWFGREYLELYGHRDSDQAMLQVQAVCAHVALSSDAIVLDLGCGGGRHLGALRDMGFRAFGLDLSAVLLEEAGAKGPVVRGDLQALPFQWGCSHLVTSFFTSFGYFDTPQQDRQLLQSMGLLLRPGGWLFLDLPQPSWVRGHLVLRENVQLSSGPLVAVQRWIEECCVHKEMRWTDGDGVEQVYRERVRLYEKAQLDLWLDACGLEVQAVLGNEVGDPWTPQSQRLSLLCCKGAV